MSGKQRTSSKRSRASEKDLERPFDPKILQEAREIASEYTLILEPHDRLGFLGSAAEFPTVFADGKTAAKCMRNVREALTVAVASVLERGRNPPLPASEERRAEQINIRLTAYERLIFDTAAKSRGFRGISDFVRTTVLSELRRTA